ncbi:MAG: hypothetical protein H7249_03770 [Chitinophagaceae bacterium]|nr:hypothetical protein [Oligoflexus sp.]
MTNTKLLFIGLLGTSSLLASCGTSSNSEVQSSVFQSIEDKWSGAFDLSREITLPHMADNLTATKSRVDTMSIGSKVNAEFSFTDYVTFTVGGGMEFGELFERKVLTEAVIGRVKDERGTQSGDGVFQDAVTVNPGVILNCKAQKVISESSNMGVNANAGISFIGMGISANASTGQKLAASTDYVMNRGYYTTKTSVKLSQIFELCQDIGKSDIALQNVDHINDVIQLNFSGANNLEKLAKDVAAGKKVNNFQYKHIKYDFQRKTKDNNQVVFTIYPDTGYADPKLESTVKYQMDGQRAVIEDVSQKCVSNCQNYIDQNGKHGLHSYGDKATKAEAESSIKVISTIFAAAVLGSK